MLHRQVRVLLECYPKIYHACHTRHVRDPATRRVVSARQVQILDHLDTVEPTAVGDLAGHLDVTPSTMSLALDRLARDGYVRRVRDRRDGRRVHVLLTASGARVREANSVLDPRRVRRLLEHVPPARRRAALAGLETLAEAAGRAVSPRSRPSPRTVTRRKG